MEKITNKSEVLPDEMLWQALRTQTKEQLINWLSEYGHVPDAQGEQNKCERNCLWPHAIRLALKNYDCLDDMKGDSSLERNCSLMDMQFLQDLKEFVGHGLKISYSYYYRTSFLYDTFFYLCNIGASDQIEDSLLELYEAYIAQKGSREVRVFGDLIDILSFENHQRWKAKTLREELVKGIIFAPSQATSGSRKI